MIYLKYFEAQTQQDWDIADCFKPFLEKYNMKAPDYVLKYPRSYDITFTGSFNRLGGSFEIVNNAEFFGSKCIFIRISSQSNLIKKGLHKGFDGFSQEDQELLKECNLKVGRMLLKNNRLSKAFIGSVGYYNKDFDIVYLFQEPDMSRHGDVEIYGSNLVVKLDDGHEIISNSRHSNCFDVFKDGRIQALSSLYGSAGYGTSLTLSPGAPKKPIENWMQSEWDKICDEMDITDFQEVGSDPKITVAEFMTHLKNNQQNFRS